MQRWIPLFFLLLLFSSCGEKEETSTAISAEQPADLIPEDKMIQVLADVHLLESALSYRSPGAPTPSRSPFMISSNEQVELPPAGSQESLPYYDIFAKNGYTREQYERSLKWYSLDAVKYSEMYDEVINELTRRQAKENAGQPVIPDTSKK